MTDDANILGGDRPVAEESSTSSGLLAGLRDQDPEAWRRMVTVFTPPVYQQARRAGLAREDAEDVVQEVLRTVAARIGEYKHGGPTHTFHGWLYVIARNKIGDLYDQRKKHPLPQGGSSAQQHFQQLAGDDASEDEAFCFGLAVQQALDLVRAEFAGQQWEAFVQMVQHGRLPADVAAELNITLNQAYLAKSRILRRLRETLGEVE